MPWWTEVLVAAEKWGVPPWILEETAPDIWMERALLWNNARVERSTNRKPAVGESHKRGNKRVKRLV